MIIKYYDRGYFRSFYNNHMCIGGELKVKILYVCDDYEHTFGKACYLELVGDKLHYIVGYNNYNISKFEMFKNEYLFIKIKE